MAALREVHPCHIGAGFEPLEMYIKIEKRELERQ